MLGKQHLHPTSLPAEIYFWKQFNGLLITLIGFVSRWLLISALLRSLKQLHDGGKLVQPGAARGCAGADGSCRLPQDRGTDIDTALWVSQQGEPLDTRMAEHQHVLGRVWKDGFGVQDAPLPLGQSLAPMRPPSSPWARAPGTPSTAHPSHPKASFLLMQQIAPSLTNTAGGEGKPRAHRRFPSPQGRCGF